MRSLQASEIATYLQYGYIKPVPKIEDPATPDPIYLDEANRKLRNALREAVQARSNPDTIFLLSGGIDSSTVVSLAKQKEPRTVCAAITGRLDAQYARRTSEWLGTNHIELGDKALGDLDSCLTQMQRLWDRPHCDLGDLFVYHICRSLCGKTDSLVGGEGSEFLLMGFAKHTAMVKHSILRGDGHYRKELAETILRGSRHTPSDRADIYQSTREPSSEEQYLSYYISKLRVFSDEEIRFLGSEPKEMMLPPDSLGHALSFLADWHLPAMVTDRCSLFSKHFGIHWEFPFLDKGVRDCCETMPYEMKNCLGSPRHVLVEMAGELIPRFVLERANEGFEPKVPWFESIRPQIIALEHAYLDNRNARLYDFIDYDSAVHFRPENRGYLQWRKSWVLLNLAIWLEVA